MRVKIHIPDTLNEITLEQYQEYLKIQEQEKDQYVLGSKMIEIFCKVPFKIYLNIGYRILTEYQKH